MTKGEIIEKLTKLYSHLVLIGEIEAANELAECIKTIKNESY